MSPLGAPWLVSLLLNLKDRCMDSLISIMLVSIPTPFEIVSCHFVPHKKTIWSVASSQDTPINHNTAGHSGVFVSPYKINTSEKDACSGKET